MNRVIHFEIHAVDAKKIADFYKKVFGWEVTKWEGMEYWMVMTAPEKSKEPGINGGITVRKGRLPNPGEPISSFVCTIGVSSVDDYINKINKAGGTLAVPKMAIPGMAWLAYCKDPEGNIFGIYEDNKDAK